MNQKFGRKYCVHKACPEKAFTLIELLVVIGILCLLTCFMLPAFARAKIKSPDAGCLSNLRQMQLGWAMYRDDNNDYLLPNAPFGYAANQSWCGPNTMDWFNADGNTNWTHYTNALMAPYIGNQIGLYRCPADTIPSQTGTRVRSYSMNGQMGCVYTSQNSQGSFDSGAEQYIKGSDLKCLKPASGIVFLDESTWTLLSSSSDGYVQISTTSFNPCFPDTPAAWHNGGCGLSFADGHAEIHKWATTVLTSVPYVYGQTRTAGAIGATCPSSNTDWIYFSQHTACKVNGTLGP